MANKPTNTLALTDEQQAALRSLAKAWGLTIGRGSMADDGSILQLVASLASGDAGFFLVASDEDYSLTGRLREVGAENPDLNNLLNAVAVSLERAGRLYHDTDWHALALDRVRSLNRLAANEDFIMADWPEGDRHWRWVVNASESEILSWVRAGKK